MKKMFNRSLFVVLAAAMLVTAALVSNCAGPLDGGAGAAVKGGNKAQTFQPPAGMGYIRIKVVNNKARATFIPDLPDINTLDYRIWVEDKTNSNNIEFDTNTDPSNFGGGPVNYDDLSDYPVMLVPGNLRYRVNVAAYNPGTTDIIGYKMVDNVTVDTTPPAGGNTVVVDLEPYTDGAEDGKFIYTITLPSNRIAAAGDFSAILDVENYITGYSDVPLSLRNQDLITNPGSLTNAPAGVSLPSGFYYVRIAMADNDTSPPTPSFIPALQSRTVTNIVHVYQNLESTITLALADLNPFSYLVTYNATSSTVALIPATPFGPYAHNTTVPITAQPATPTHQTTGYTFNSWHWANNTAAGYAWVFDDGTNSTTTAKKIIGPLTLYAIWDSSIPIELAISLGWAGGTTPPSLVESTKTFTRADFYSGVIQTVTVSFSNLDSFTVVGWKDELTSGYISTSNTLTISTNNASQIGYFSPGEHTFYAIVEKGSSGPLDVEFVLNVVE